MKRPDIRVAVVLIMAVALAVVRLGGVGQAADHHDAPLITEDPRADLADLFTFVNPNNGNIVLAWTVNGFSIPGEIGVAFSSNVLYRFNIDNTGDNVEDLVIDARFTPNPPPFQAVTVTEPHPPKATRFASLTGPANGTVFPSTGSIRRLFAGERDDPFFVDLIWWIPALRLFPIPLPPRPPGIQYHAGLNVSALAVEVPPEKLRGKTGNIIKIWTTTARQATTLRTNNKDEQRSGPFVQIDRTAIPAVAPILPFKTDEFNRSFPKDDRRVFRGVVLASLVRINNNPAYSAIIADRVLPDVQTLDMTSLAGFPNGRRPQDDINDVITDWYTGFSAGRPGALRSDNVDANDVPFLLDFPFLAPPHQPTETIPPRT
jgi:Domain of unknown function (DUF4331)